VSALIERGAIVGILGPNGSGKTTLLRVMGGMLEIVDGSIILDGRGIRTIPRQAVARRIAVVPQETQVAFEYSVLEMVLMGRYPHLAAFELEGPRDLAIAREAMAATGTSALEHRSFGSLSGGEKQRVVIAGAVAQQSEMMLLDEPTASLDIGYQVEIGALLRRLNSERGITMVIATHDLNFAASLCRQLILLRDGEILSSGPAESVLTPAAVRQLYGVDAEVRRHERTGHLTIVPIGRASVQ
jgi:iron complex transport system ATP-binding protein